MVETRKLAAILVSDVVGYSRLAGSDEDRTLARLRALRSDLIDPIIAVHNGRVVKRTGDGSIVEFRSVVDAVRCAIEVQNGMVERNAGLPPERRIEFRIGIHVGDVVEESDGDLMGDGVNIAARLEGIAKPGAICLSEDAYRQVKSRLDLAVSDLGPIQLKNIAEPVRVFSCSRRSAKAKPTKPSRQAAFDWCGWSGIVALAGFGRRLVFPWPPSDASVASNAPTVAKAGHLSIVVLPFTNLSRRSRARIISPMASPRTSRPTSRASAIAVRHCAQHRFHLQGQEHPHQGDQQGTGCALCPRRLGAARPEPCPRQRATYRWRDRRASLGRPVRRRLDRRVQAARSGEWSAC